MQWNCFQWLNLEAAAPDGGTPHLIISRLNMPGGAAINTNGSLRSAINGGSRSFLTWFTTTTIIVPIAPSGCSTRTTIVGIPTTGMRDVQKSIVHLMPLHDWKNVAREDMLIT